MSPHDLLLMSGLFIVAGLIIYIIAGRLGIPSIILLLAGGVILGPEILGLIEPDALGDGLRVIVSLIVAIIVFEGGFVLDIDYLRHLSTPVRNLITIGCAVTVVLAAAAAHWFAGFPWPVAWLFGTLVCVTGPTVVNPLMRIANANQRVTVTLMAEGVLIDAVGAILAVVALNFLLASEPTLTASALSIALHLGTGAIVGIVGGYVLAWLLRQLNPELPGPARLGTLAGALAIFLAAEALLPESGIAAAAASGIMIGNLPIPHAARVKQFKDDLSVLGLSVLFILLAARLRFADLINLGVGGLLTVFFLMVVVRPLGVWLSTIGTRLRRNERLFIAAIGPRGVVAASVSTFAAIQLEAAGYQGTSGLIGLVFLTVILTVVIQGTYVRYLAQILGVVPMHIIVVGSDDVALSLAGRLVAHNDDVTLIDRDGEVLEAARGRGFTVVIGDATTARGLEAAGIKRARALVAATPSDKANMLACQVARSKYGLEDLVARANKPENVEIFQSLGIRAMSPTVSTAIILDNLVRRPNALALLTEIDGGMDLVEVKLNNPDVTERPLRDLSLSGNWLIGMVHRDGNIFIPHGNFVLRAGDVLTLLGDPEEVAAAAEWFDGIGR